MPECNEIPATLSRLTMNPQFVVSQSSRIYRGIQFAKISFSTLREVLCMKYLLALEIYNA